jgi:exodeoxyribonuclease VII large subunit
MGDADLSPPVVSELDSDDVVTVETLNDEIADALASTADLQHEYVIGDVSDRRVANGHVHFDLDYEDASIHCVLFGFRRDGDADEPEADTQVAVRGELSYYEAQGSCSILVTDVVAMGDSEYSRIFQENRQLLDEKGFLDEECKQPLPELPRSVGLVTSADRDARIDAETAIHERYPDVDIVLYDASVQGPEALQELMGGIATLDEDPRVDVIVLTRGGGADTTLRTFNEVPLCRVIAESETPIVVGIGHEDDHTLAGAVADRRVMTPTHTGDIVPLRSDLENQCTRLRDDLERAYDVAVEDRIERYETTLNNAYETTVVTRLQGLQARLDHATERHVETRLSELRMRLDAAYRDFERQHEYEQELKEALASVRSEAAADIAATRRRYRIVLAILVILLLVFIIVYGIQP